MYVYVGPPQQYPGQEDYYGDQYSHAGQGASEGRRTLQSLGENQQKNEPRSCVKTQMMQRDCDKKQYFSFFIIFWEIKVTLGSNRDRASNFEETSTCQGAPYSKS